MSIRRLSELAVAAAIVFGALPARAAPASDLEAGVRADDDPMAAYREQFKRGMDRYKAGALAETIGFWEPVYRELGAQKGYRLAYNLGVVYQELGDATHTAERLQSFLDQVDALRARGESLAPIVEREAVDGRARMARLAATKGRIVVVAGVTPRAARVDAGEPRLAGFVAWVTPGEHTVQFAEGTPGAEVKTVQIRAGETAEVSPTPPPPSPPPPPEPLVVLVRPSPQAMVVAAHQETFHPFAWPIIAATGGVAIAAAIAAVPLYAYESNLYTRYAPESPRPADHSDTYNRLRSVAYLDVGGAIGFAAVTAGLATWYLLGSSERDVGVTAGAGATPRGASISLRGRF